MDRAMRIAELFEMAEDTLSYRCLRDKIRKDEHDLPYITSFVRTRALESSCRLVSAREKDMRDAARRRFRNFLGGVNW